DRLKQGLTPACAQACPTESIRFGPIIELKKQATQRVSHLHEQGEGGAYLYGADDNILGGLNSFYLLVDKPEVYGLPSAPKLPTRNLWPSSLFSAAGALLVGFLAILGLRTRRSRDAGAERTGVGDDMPADARSEEHAAEHQ